MATFLEQMDGGLGLVWRRLWAWFLWIYLLVNLEVTGVLSEMCVYRRSKYNWFESRYDQTFTTKDCQWGCCDDHNSPCCTAPVSLIVGCVLGGVLMFALLLIAVFCCCVCKRRNAAGSQRRNAVLRFGAPSNASAATQQTTVVYHSESSGNVPVPDHVMFDAPPSYEEVMRGETNLAFKPDSD